MPVAVVVSRVTPSSRARRVLPRLALVALLGSAVSAAQATAYLGSTIGLVDGTSPCSRSAQIPNTTQQDTLHLALSACGTQSAEARGAATGVLGLRASSAGGTSGIRATSASISLLDHWVIAVPPGTANGSVFTIPVTLKIDGAVSAGAVHDARSPGFLQYTVSVIDFYGSGPGFFAQDYIGATGPFAQTLTGSVTFNYLGAAVPSTLEVSMDLSIPALYDGTVDFYNTAALSLGLPPGFTATTSSNIPLVALPNDPPPTGAVPEPGTLTLGGIGLLALVGRTRRKVFARR